MEFRRWGNLALDLLFPPICAACGALGPLICDQCRSQMLRIHDPLCQRCGRSLLYAAPVCAKCRQPSFCLQQVRAPLAYQDPAAGIIHRFKYDGLFALAKPLAEIMVAAWPDWANLPDALVPIPLHKRRERRRGFNQASLLAGFLGEKTEIPVNDRALQRTRHTLPQIGLTPQERFANVKDAFMVVGNTIKNKHIMLVDDVFTTGATMSAAAETLLASGAAGVSAYCLARTVQ